MALLGAACASAPDPEPQPSAGKVTVLAASSLVDVFDALADALTDRDGPALAVSPGGSAQLVAQLEAGAPADVLATADDATMARARRSGAVKGEAAVFATNRLVIAVPRGNPARITALADLARDGVVVSLAAPEVPAGAYARDVLDRANVSVRPATAEQSVRAVLTKVVLGEVDAGLVYATDIGAAGGKVEALTIPDAANVEVRYLVATVRRDPAPQVAGVIDALLGSEGRSLLRRLGFGPPVSG